MYGWTRRTIKCHQSKLQLFYNLHYVFLPSSKIVATYHGSTSDIEIIGDIHWPGGADGPPLDTPFCGYHNENPLCREKGRNKNKTLGFIKI